MYKREAHGQLALEGVCSIRVALKRNGSRGSRVRILYHVIRTRSRDGSCGRRSRSGRHSRSDLTDASCLFIKQVLDPDKILAQGSHHREVLKQIRFACTRVQADSWHSIVKPNLTTLFVQGGYHHWRRVSVRVCSTTLVSLDRGHGGGRGGQ